MSCSHVKRQLSAFIDRELRSAESRAVGAHLRACQGCAAELVALEGALAALHDLPRVPPTGSLAAAVLDRSEVERRGASLQMLFRPAWRSRPLMLPSLLQGAVVVAVVLSGALSLDRLATPSGESAGPAGTAWGPKVPASGTEANPLFPSSGVVSPQPRGNGPLPGPFLSAQGEGSVFLETVVARDGSVSAVNLIEGDSEEARALADVLRLERFVPARVGGRPVAVSLYRLFSRMEVRARRT